MSMQTVTVTLHWLDIILGTFALCVWLEYKGSLVDDLARFIERKLKEPW